MSKRHWFLSVALCLGAGFWASPSSSQALLPYTPNLDSGQIEDQGVALTEDVLQLVRFQRYDLALARAKLATQLAPQRFQTWFILGTLYLQKKEIQPGIDVLLKAEAMAPKEAGIKFTLGNAYFQKGDYPAAIASLQAGLKIKPDTTSALFDLGNTYLKIKQYGEAIPAFEQAIKADKSFWPAINNLGLIQYERGDIEGALAKWNTALSLDAEQSEPQLAIAVALYKQGKSSEGLQTAEIALKRDSRYADINFLIENLWGDQLVRDTRSFFANPAMKTLLQTLPPPTKDDQQEI